jgi:hypothetical protein
MASAFENIANLFGETPWDRRARKQGERSLDLVNQRQLERDAQLSRQRIDEQRASDESRALAADRLATSQRFNQKVADRELQQSFADVNMASGRAPSESFLSPEQNRQLAMMDASTDLARHKAMAPLAASSAAEGAYEQSRGALPMMRESGERSARAGIDANRASSALSNATISLEPSATESTRTGNLWNVAKNVLGRLGTEQTTPTELQANRDLSKLKAFQAGSDVASFPQRDQNALQALTNQGNQLRNQAADIRYAGDPVYQNALQRQALEAARLGGFQSYALGSPELAGAALPVRPMSPYEDPAEYQKRIQSGAAAAYNRYHGLPVIPVPGTDPGVPSASSGYTPVGSIQDLVRRMKEAKGTLSPNVK